MLSIWGRTWAVTGDLAVHVAESWERDGWAGLRALAALQASLRQNRLEERRAEAAAPGGSSSARGVIAKIPVLGLLTQRGRVVDCAETQSTDALAATIRAASLDASIDAIVLDMDTPGGEVNGVTEAAHAIRSARELKPIVAAANGEVGSAGYWLAAQATEVIVTPSGAVGSIGVYGAHVDVSKELEAKGQKVTVVSAGKYKVERLPHAPLTDEAVQALQADVHRHYDAFVRDVARGRGVSVEAVRDGFGEGRMVGAKPAVEQGMANAVGTLDEAIARARSLATARRREGASRAQTERDILDL